MDIYRPFGLGSPAKGVQYFGTCISLQHHECQPEEEEEAYPTPSGHDSGQKAIARESGTVCELLEERLIIAAFDMSARPIEAQKG
jgi:hypothetical protein